MSKDDQIENILESIDEVEAELGRSIELVAVTKYFEVDRVRLLIESGITNLGESRVQVAIPKIEQLNQENNNLTWHLIGHLQTNKVRKAVQYFNWIQSIDSIKLLDKLESVAMEESKTLNGLIQINIGCEDQKYGFTVEEFWEKIETIMYRKYVKIRGMMAILPNTEIEETIGYFKQMERVFARLKSQYDQIDTLSMGMSKDYILAIRNGSTMVRVGSKFFML